MFPRIFIIAQKREKSTPFPKILDKPPLEVYNKRATEKSVTLETPSNETSFCFVATDARQKASHSASSAGAGTACRWRLLLPDRRMRKFLFLSPETPEGGDDDVHNLGRASSARHIPFGTGQVGAGLI